MGRVAVCKRGFMEPIYSPSGQALQARLDQQEQEKQPRYASGRGQGSADVFGNGPTTARRYRPRLLLDEVLVAAANAVA